MVVEQRTFFQQPSTVSLIKELITDLNRLLMQHVELFRYEIKEDAQIAAKTAIIAIVGALIAYTSIIFFGFFLIFFLAIFIPLWASSLIVTGIFVVISAVSVVLILRYLNKLKKTNETMIGETRKTVEDAKKWLQDLK